MEILSKYETSLRLRLEEGKWLKAKESLYDPIRYIISLGGKRIRPLLVLMSCDYFEGDYSKAMDAALAIELFHNFSLIHDDIMDNAPLRRGKETVHEKWDVNTGILSGDAMLIMAYRFLESYEPILFQDITKIFTKTALEVCIGQQADIDFETRDDVTLPEYIEMIDKKTAVLLGAAMKMGAAVAKTTKANSNIIYEFGRNLGIAFQLQDDYLDAFGDPKTFGKQLGGDILSNKKTFLYLTAMAKGSREEVESLEHLYSISPKAGADKIEIVKGIFLSSGATEALQEAIVSYTEKAYSYLEQLDISAEGKAMFRSFGAWLMNRTV